ncbi:MAG: Ycf66 family protein [Cyanobacteriota bacterium]
MVNASLNWASIVGIVLAVGGAFLYFMRSFKPALARDYDVFFAAVGLLCGGILFFQGWRLDPILQFGQFLLAGTTVFFAYESVRLRGVTTEQARRSSYFEDEEPAPFRPRGGLSGDRDWDGGRERFDEPEPLRRRIPSREAEEEDFYRPRRASRAAIPERAASRRPPSTDWDEPRGSRPGNPDREPTAASPDPSRYAPSRNRGEAEFGARRREREAGSEGRRGSRPTAAADAMPRSSRRAGGVSPRGAEAGAATVGTPGVPQGDPLRGTQRSDVSDADFAPMNPPASRPRPDGPVPSSRDNSSRFDD